MADPYDGVMTSNENNKTVRVFVWIVIGVVIGAGIFLLAIRARRVDVGSTAGAATTTDQSIADGATGYHFVIPASWYFEKNSSSGFAVYPDYSPAESSSLSAPNSANSAAPLCKIEVSIFPYSPATAPGDWIASQLSVDPTQDIKEQSTAQVALGDAQGIEWNGTMNGIPTTLVYAFTDDKAYEIAPSTLSETSTAENCGDALGILLEKFNI